MLPWLVLGLGIAGLWMASGIGRRRTRGAAQAFAVLLVATGGLLLLRRPSTGLDLPGLGPRRWHQP